VKLGLKEYQAIQKMPAQISLLKQMRMLGDARYSTDYVDCCAADRVSSAFFGACLVIVSRM